MYPNKISARQELYDDQKAKIEFLLREIGISLFHVLGEEELLTLDDKQDWYTVLSGGQKKKIMLVSAIIKEPDILILDEIFSGLDSQSIFIAQKMLKKYLPNTLILIIDHHAQENNFDNFYDNGIHLDNQMIVLKKCKTNFRI